MDTARAGQPTPQDRPLLSVVLSFRNEEAVLPELIRRLAAALETLALDYELLFVNDASTDRSLAILLEQRAANPRIRIATTSRRFGVAPCVLEGFRLARGDAVVYMDADLQDPPELIPQLVARWREGADVVHTTRTKRHGEHSFKVWLTRQAYDLIARLADISIPSDSGDFKLISRRALNQMLELDEGEAFVRGLVAWVGFRQTQVFYEREPRFAGQTRFSLWRSLNPYKELVRGIIGFSNLPLYLPLYIGLAVLPASLAGFLWIGVRAVLGTPLSAAAAIALAGLFVGGAILCAVGVLGIYVGDIHKQVKRRPRCIVSDTIGFDPPPSAATAPASPPAARSA